MPSIEAMACTLQETFSGVLVAASTIQQCDRQVVAIVEDLSVNALLFEAVACTLQAHTVPVEVARETWQMCGGWA